MLMTPKHGWTALEMGDIHVPAISYICDPHLDLCEAFSEYLEPYTNAIGSAQFDHEGTFTIVVISIIGVSVIDGVADRTYDISHEEIKHYAQELVNDLERDFDVWIDEWHAPDPDEREECADALRKSIDQLKERLENTPTSQITLLSKREENKQIS